MVQIEAISVLQNVLAIYFISTEILPWFSQTIVSCEILYACSWCSERYGDNKKKVDKTRIHFKRWMSVQSQNRIENKIYRTKNEEILYLLFG